MEDVIAAHVRRPGLLIVLSGPSGVGKDALLSGLTEVCPGVERCVTCTTRKPRLGEVDGVDYRFVDADEFRRMIENNLFLEHAQVHSNHYGSPASAPEEAARRGKDVVLKIDVQGGLSVKRKVPEVIMCFIAPPSMKELERRLRERYTDSEESITQRLQDARREIAAIPEYDYLVINDELECAIDRVRCIIMAERARIGSENGSQSEG